VSAVPHGPQSPHGAVSTRQPQVFESALSGLSDEACPPLRNPPLLEQTEDLTNLSYLNEPAGMRPWFR
jgi:myosin heavy subunit